MAVKPVDANKGLPPVDSQQQAQKSKGAVPPQESGQKTGQPGQAPPAKDSVSIGPKRKA